MNVKLDVFGLSRVARLVRASLVLGAVPLGILACGPGEEPTELTCGPGTEEKNGVCVAIVDPIASCGDGTEFDEDTGACEPTVRCGDGTLPNDAGECVPSAVCGPGTELELATGQCIPIASCGPGTVLDPTSGACVSEVACGPGTDLVDGECVAVGLCATGSVLNVDTGLCESHLECGPGQVIANGLCVAPNVGVGLEADFFESSPDVNDPAHGGTPEALTLEAIGEKTVFVGNISRPTDYVGNGVLAQDRDVWAFDGVAGQYLRVSVLGTGLPQPAFILDGPHGYQRSSSLLSTQNAIREVVLPYTGRYELTIVPTAYLTTGIAVGGANAGYVGVIEELAKPTPTALTPGTSQDSPTEVSGNLRDLSDNFFLLEGQAGDAVSLVFADVDAAMPPAIVAFDSSGALVTHVDVDVSFGDWVGTLVKEGGTTIVVDWQSSTTSEDAFTLTAAQVPHAGTIAVAPDAKGEATPVAVPPSRLVAYTISNTDPLVLSWTTWKTGSGALSGPDVQVLPASGKTFLMPDRANAVTPLYAEPNAERTIFVYNDTTTENDAIFIWEGEPVTDFGTLDPQNGDEASAGGALLTPDPFGPRGEWMVVSLAEPGLLKLHPDLALGDAELFYYSLWGVELHEHPLPDQAIPTHYIVEDEPVLVRIQSAGSNVTLDWSLRAEALPYPLTHLDQEPNDTLEQAVPVGDLPVRLVGHLESTGEVDVYRIDVPEPVNAGEAIVVHIENIDTITNGTATDAAIITIQDEDGEVLPAAQVSPNVNRVTYYIDSSATQSSSAFFIHLQNQTSASTAFNPDHRYLIDISVVAGTFEVEPNNTLAEADEAESFPVAWEAHWHKDDDLDVFAFTLDEAIPSDKLLELRFHSSSNGATLALLREDETEVLTGGGTLNANTRLSVGGLEAGRYFITVKGSVTATFRYRVGVDLIDKPLLEVEPNNAVGDATDLGGLGSAPLVVFGETRSSDPDWFRFSIDPPLGPTESVRFRCLAITGSGTLECDLHDLSDPATPVFLGRTRQTPGALSFATDATEIGISVVNSSTSARAYAVWVERSGGAAEKEPNNDALSADPLGELSDGGVLFQTGNITLNDEDWFSFTLDDDFVLSGQGIWVSVDNRYNNTAFIIALYDISDPSAPRLLNQARTARGAVMSAPSGGTEYAVQVTLPSGSGSFVYDLLVEGGPAAELEPNNTSAEANDLGALPASVHGIITHSQPDFFQFTLPAALGPTELVEVVYETIGSTTGYLVELSHAGGALIEDSDGNKSHAVLHTDAGASAGTYEIAISRSGSTSFTYQYRLDVRVVDIASTP